MTDENKIRVEKIGSGNWYWSFVSEAKKEKEKALTSARAQWEKVNKVVQELTEKVEAAKQEREDDEDAVEGESREDLELMKAQLEREIMALRKELASYSESDPVELERRKAEAERLKMLAMRWTDDVCSMEGYFLNAGMSREQLKAIKEAEYGDEYDEEDECLREIC